MSDEQLAEYLLERTAKAISTQRKKWDFIDLENKEL